ncbi:ABC transporter ATP-binding protein [Bacillus sp. FJAT-50079]|uniref:ABC transporter ATP-binding protein n=1 Tax=Bacillus sp. FJAT-50079 TaxID=2833577 RepID=UPI001BCA08AF|nr:ABC transporter ATP-binding protein [Bacillus sp. FJAT-50079]MBS4207054.1 ABC transporter ATP-binding protein [Bacillus sp. FJAT-50079]
MSIHVKNLRLKFPGEPSLIFEDLSFSVKSGEKVLLLGPSGCGKSTLLQVLSGIIPHSIEVPLKYDSFVAPNSWGFVFQDPDTQFCMPYVDEELAFVLENLNVPRDEMDIRIEEVLERVGLRLDEPHTPIQHLSQGMKQRLALASVLLLEPEVIFLDEPTALLDPEGTVQIWESVKAVAKDKTVIIVEHKIDQIADWVERVVLFNETGEVIADGAPELIFTKHKRELIEYGIWYPNVWEDYIASSHFLKQKRSDQGKEIIQLRNFNGYRGKERKIHIGQGEVCQGSWIAIVGENGAGKSTFLLSLMHLLHTTGHYELDGKMLDLQEKKKKPPIGLSLVFQNPELQFITNSVFDELAFSIKGENIREKVEDLLNLFHLNINENRHPFQLSIGQKRRLSVATALAHGAKVLLLDEPTFGQDAKNTFAMLEKLEKLRKEGTTIIMVTHDSNIVDHFATEVWTIHKGVFSKGKQEEKQDARIVHAT